MKKVGLTKVLAVLILALLLNSCKDGDNGISYLRIIQDNTSLNITYWDDNGGIPYNFSWGRYYQVYAGTYSYNWGQTNPSNGAYYYCDGNSYRIDVESGENWSPIKNGYLTQAKSGTNRYYTLHISDPYSTSTCINISYSHRPITGDSLEVSKIPVYYPAAAAGLQRNEFKDVFKYKPVKKVEKREGNIK